MPISSVANPISLKLINNRFYNNAIETHNIYLSDCIEPIIEGNEIHGGYIGLKTANGRNIVFRNNHVHGQKYTSLTIGGSDMGPDSTVRYTRYLGGAILEGNIIHDTPRGIHVKWQDGGQPSRIENMHIRNNNLYNVNGAAAILVENSSLFDCSITGNTILNSYPRGISFNISAEYTNVMVANNNLQNIQGGKHTAILI